MRPGTRLVVAGLTAAIFAGCAEGAAESASPDCAAGPGEISDELIIEAQSVPTATFVPCIESLPSGWGFGFMDARDGHTRIVLRQEQSARELLEVRLTRSCDFTGDTEVPSTQEGVRQYTWLDANQPTHVAGHRHLVFDGGCITYRFDFTGPTRSALLTEIDLVMGLVPRDDIAAAVEEAGFSLDP